MAVVGSGIESHSTRSTLATLAAGQAVGLLLARHVVGIADVDRLGAGPPFLLHEDEGPGADGARDLRRRRRFGDRLGHDEQRVGERLGERVQHQAERIAQRQGEGEIVHRVELGAGREQGLADDVAVLPAQDRGDGVGGPHRAAVMEFQATAQAEHPGLAVVGDLPAVDHLRLRLAARIEREELIVDEIAVIGRVGRGVEHRVDAAHVDGEDDLEHLARPNAPDGWR